MSSKNKKKTLTFWYTKRDKINLVSELSKEYNLEPLILTKSEIDLMANFWEEN